MTESQQVDPEIAALDLEYQRSERVREKAGNVLSTKSYLVLTSHPDWWFEVQASGVDVAGMGIGESDSLARAAANYLLNAVAEVDEYFDKNKSQHEGSSAVELREAFLNSPFDDYKEYAMRDVIHMVEEVVETMPEGQQKEDVQFHLK